MKLKIILGILSAGVIAYLYYAFFHLDVTDEQTTPADKTVATLVSTLCAGVYFGFLAVFYVLPVISQKMAQSVLGDSSETAEPDMLNEARALVAQGDYENAVVEYRKALIIDPSNRLAWNDMAKIYAEKLKQPQMAIASIREAYDENEWEEEDGAFLLFRLSEWQFEDCEDQEAGVATLNEVIEAYPDTRHSANAMQQLRQLEA